MSASELYLLKFIETLIIMTEKKEKIWESESAEHAYKFGIDSHGNVVNPLFRAEKDENGYYYSGGELQIDDELYAVYDSYFFNELSTTLIGDICKVDLDETNNLYISKVNVYESNDVHHKNPTTIYEVYIVGATKVKQPVCKSYKLGTSLLDTKVKNLYISALQSSKLPRLNTVTYAIIESFLKQNSKVNNREEVE